MMYFFLNNTCSVLCEDLHHKLLIPHSMQLPLHRVIPVCVLTTHMVEATTGRND